jgi:hypothetical protein
MHMHPRHPVLDAIADFSDELRTLEAESTELRRLSPAVVKKFREIGVMRIVQPACYGGFEADPRVFNEAVYAISRASSSAGWVTGVVGVHSWNIGLFDDATQREVLGEDPDTWISSSYGPAGKAERDPGGHVLSGRWSFSSGSDYPAGQQWARVGIGQLDPVETGRPHQSVGPHPVPDRSGRAADGGAHREGCHLRSAICGRRGVRGFRPGRPSPSRPPYEPRPRRGNVGSR